MLATALCTAGALAPAGLAAPATPAGLSTAARDRLQWFTWYGPDAKQPGNLALATNLTLLDEISAATGKRALWDIGDAMCGEAAMCNGTKTANDTTPCGKVWNEPFCRAVPSGSAPGPAPNYLVELAKVASHVAARPHVAGIFLGDEGMLLGIPLEGFCTLAGHLQRALKLVGRSDVFVYFNDGPDQMQAAVKWQRGGRRCGDYFSMDNYLDGGEAEMYRSYYRKVAPLLLPGQGFFMVPGLFWYMKEPMPNAYEHTLIKKLQFTYDYAVGDDVLRSTVVGLNPWHWFNNPKCSEPSCCRGAQDFGNITAMATVITYNISCGGCLPPLGSSPRRALGARRSAGT